MLYMNKELSQENLESCIVYRRQYLHKKIRGFQEFVNFTDKFYIDSTKLEREHTLREEKTRLNKENIQQRLKLERIKFYVAS